MRAVKHLPYNRRTPAYSPPHSGFTLVELLVTVAVLAVVLALAVPAFKSFVQDDRQWAQQNSLVMSLNAARSEAIKQDVGGGVSVCASVDGLTCGPAGTAWSQGWIVSSAASPKPVMSVGALPAGTTLTEAGGATAVTFLSSGMVAAPVAFTMCDGRGAAQSRYTQVTFAGRVLSAGQPGMNLAGAALTCP